MSVWSVNHECIELQMKRCIEKMEWKGHWHVEWMRERVLTWFGLMQRKDVYQKYRRVLMMEVIRGQVLGRLRLGWMDGMNVVFGSIGMMVEAEQQCWKDRKESRALMHMWIIECNYYY